jgi:DNA-binding HxlR family transcriptional regulator
MVITSSPSKLASPHPDFDLIARHHKILASSTRLRVLSALESSSLSFTDLMRSLGLNPKTLSSGLSLMADSGLVRKSYPYHVYVITPLGRRILREQVLALWESLQLMGGFERRPA